MSQLRDTEHNDRGINVAWGPALAALVALSSCATPTLATAAEATDTVARVVDGDTVELASGEKVRIRGINTPEVHGRRECGGPEASTFARQSLLNKQVRVVTDSGDLRDRWGRLVAELHLADGSYAAAVTRAGWAEAQTFKRAHPASDRATIETAQADAQAARRGIWGTLCGRTG